MFEYYYSVCYTEMVFWNYTTLLNWISSVVIICQSILHFGFQKYYKAFTKVRTYTP